MAFIHRVDAHNFHIKAVSFISAARQCRSSLVFFDTEFPGTVFRSDKHYSRLSPAERYALVKQNVDVMQPIQIGITLSDGISTSTWQFDLCDFDLRCHIHAPESIAFLKSSGIDLERNIEVGIHSTFVVRLLFDAGLIGLSSTTTWVTFHGCYDFAILVKALLQQQMGMQVPLPKTLETFMQVTRCHFGGCIYDIKCIVNKCNGLYGGLEKVAEKLKVDRSMGKAHHAGSDSLLVCQVFFKIKKMYFNGGSDEEEKKIPYEGIISGLNG